MHACGIQSCEQLLGGDHRFAVDGDGVGGVGFEYKAEWGARSGERGVVSLAGEDEVDREVHEPDVALDDDRQQVDQAFDVRAPGEPRVELAGPQAQLPAQLSTERNWYSSNRARSRPWSSALQGMMPSPVSGQLSSWRMATTWPGIALPEIVKRVVARDAGHAGDEERQRDAGSWGE